MARTAATFVKAQNKRDVIKYENMTIDDVDKEIAQEVEEIYAALKEQGAGAFTIDFDTADERNEYERHARGYCLTRPQGQLYFRLNPTKGKPDTHMRFQVRDMPTGDKSAAEINAAVNKVKEAAK